MKHLERDFWNLIREKLPGEVERVENAVNSGMPDISCAYEKDYWIELKAVDGNNQTSPLTLLRPSQIIWHKKRGRQGSIIFVFVKYNDRIVMYRYVKEEYLVFDIIDRNKNRTYNWDRFTDAIRWQLAI
jgi:hypothetical protein